MLAHSAYPRRQQPSSSSSSPSPSPFSFFDQPSYDYSPSSPLYNDNTQRNYHSPLHQSYHFDHDRGHSLDLESSASLVDAHLQPDSESYHYMTAPFAFYPPIRVHQSTPGPARSQQFPPFYDSGNPVGQSASWSRFGEQAHLSADPRYHRLQSHGQCSSHKRNSSGSSVGSVGPASPYTPASSFPRIVDSDSTLYPPPGYETPDNIHGTYSSFTKPSPHSFLAPSYPHHCFPSLNNVEAMVEMRRAVMAQQESNLEEGTSSFRRSSYGADCDEGSKAPTELRSNMPKLDRTMSDIYQDELYNPTMTTSASTPPSSRVTVVQNKLLSPQTDVFSERLQAAKKDHMTARSMSPATTISRERSPFRQGSEWATEAYPQSHSPPPRMLTAAQVRERRKAEADAAVLAQHQPTNDGVRPVDTISPKEVELDYSETEEDSKRPLFPQAGSPKPVNGVSDPFTALHPSSQESTRSDATDSVAQHDFARMGGTRRESSSFSANSGSGNGRLDFTGDNNQVPQQYPFISQSRRQTSSLRNGSDQVPEFPTNLTSMESTNSENGAQSSQEPGGGGTEIERPTNTMADSGTYSCPIAGCTLRFDTSTKMLKHKRDNHRHAISEHDSPTGASCTSSGRNSVHASAASLATRNSQAGPHKCERINPSTGKPCNSVFSRPYDLTRHEDTIHNTRKHKVRCQMCTEEKTFSRNDALTRHMRVVHPEVDFPGKTKRKGGM